MHFPKQTTCLTHWGLVTHKCVGNLIASSKPSSEPMTVYNWEKYPLSPVKPRFLALIEQYLPNISDLVYSVHKSFMWLVCLNWRKSAFYPITAPNDSKCWPTVTSAIQELAPSNCDVTMTDCSHVVSMDAFLAQWCWGQCFDEFVKDTSVPSFSESMKTWNICQMTSWLTGKGQFALHEIMVLIIM